MTRALVLGGGGPVGVAWEAGLIEGFARKGVLLGQADMVYGTSAGSLVGSALKAGLDLAAMVQALRESRESALSGGGGAGSGELSGSGAPATGIERLMNAIASATSSARSRDEALKAIGRVAVESPGISEELFLSFFGGLRDVRFPAGFACTAVDTETGEFVIWDSSSAVDLQRAVASSCAVPAVYSPVEINGRLYMDGGMRNPLNADIAKGHDQILVLSVMMLSVPEGMSNPMFEALSRDVAESLGLLRSSGAAVGVVGPSERFLEISGYGASLMDLAQIAAAYEEGIRQGEAEAAAVETMWNAVPR